MASFKTVVSHQESQCVNCGEQIQPGTAKVVYKGYRTYKTSHIHCIKGDTTLQTVESEG